MVRAAITSGITNDLGSGSNVDCCCITKGKVRSRLVSARKKKRFLARKKKRACRTEQVEMYRNIDPSAPKWKTPAGFPFSRGTTGEPLPFSFFLFFLLSCPRAVGFVALTESSTRVCRIRFCPFTAILQENIKEIRKMVDVSDGVAAMDTA